MGLQAARPHPLADAQGRPGVDAACLPRYVPQCP
jgi:hypothetical protein